MPEHFRKQDFASIKKACLAKGTLFEDPEFPATTKSLYYSKIPKDVKWVRPGELCKVPRLIVDGVTCDDLITGEIKNSWFITACTALAQIPTLWKAVVPDHKTQDFDESKKQYAGIFKFHFWRFGKQTEVVIDDRLPTVNGKLMFLHSKDKNEFWSALLEKAYAKLFGDYESMSTGHPSDALVDFTGGVSEKLELIKMKLDDPLDRKILFNKLETASDQGALINCVIRLPANGEPYTVPGDSNPTSSSEATTEPTTDASKKSTNSTVSKGKGNEKEQGKGKEKEQGKGKEKEQRNSGAKSNSSGKSNSGGKNNNAVKKPAEIGDDGPHGLVIGQGYNITMVKTVEVKKSHVAAVNAATLQLIRIFNPWRPKEWTGPWSDHSPEWKAITAHEWAKMGVKFEKEGEFWMCFDDFLKYFTDADICHFVNTSFFTLKKSWHETCCFSEWSSSGRNGGNVRDSISFLCNPQFLFDIVTEEPDQIMVSLEQRDVSDDRVALETKNTIGFFIIKVEANRKYRIHLKGKEMFRSEFQMSRNVFGTCKLPKGRYVMIPCTQNTNGFGHFMIRLYTSKGTAGKMLELEAPPTGCCRGAVRLTSTITVIFLDELQLPDASKARNSTLDPYIIVRCEGDKVTSGVLKNTTSPVFDLSATFYRKKPTAQPIIIEVYKKNMMFDDFLGMASIDIPKEKGLISSESTTYGDETGEKKVYNLYGQKADAKVMKPGNVTVFIQSSDDPQAL